MFAATVLMRTPEQAGQSTLAGSPPEFSLPRGGFPLVAALRGIESPDVTVPVPVHVAAG